MFYFLLKKFLESAPRTTHIHAFKVNKQNFLTSIIVGINISDHIKNKIKRSACIRELKKIDTWEAKIKVTIDQPQILYIYKTRLQSTIEIVPKIALLKFLKII
jgi:hypothetical protein